MRRALIALIASILLAPTSSQALQPEEENSIRQVIVGQMNAFANKDAALALSFASPHIQRIFRSPKAFISMVKRGYDAVYQPSSVAFDDIVEVNGRVLQPLHVRDKAGIPFKAVYDMQRQEDGDWKINGVQLRRDNSASNI